jgi:adenosylmethionine-8-amino-7-oxononanoate aminotransferase
VCLAARAHGLLTRPILDTLVLMPPLATTPAELDHALAALDAAISANLGIDTPPASA